MNVNTLARLCRDRLAAATSADPNPGLVLILPRPASEPAGDTIALGAPGGPRGTLLSVNAAGELVVWFSCRAVVRWLQRRARARPVAVGERSTP